MNSDLFIKLPPTKLFFRCAVPAVITSVFGALYSVVDGVFVGRFLGENALAAVNLIMPIIMIVEALSNMIATGASVNISILLGQQKREDAARVFSFSVKIILLFSCVIGVVGFFCASSFVTLIAPGANQEAIRLSTDYLQIYALFAPLVTIYFATDNFLRVCGKQKISMAISVATQAANVILDFILIVILHQGVKAAAIASCVSIAAGSVVTLILFLRKRMDVYYTKENISARQFLRITANGSSEFFSNIAASVMSVVMNLFANMFIAFFQMGIANGVQPILGYCYGAGQLNRMKAIFRRVLIAVSLTSVVTFFFMLLAGPHVAKLFIKPGNTELLRISATAIRIFSFSYLVGWVDLCFSSYFTALDRPVRSLLLSFFGTMVFPIVFLFLLTAVWGLNGVWLMTSVAAVASGLLALLLDRTLKLEHHSGSLPAEAAEKNGHGG